MDEIDIIFQMLDEYTQTTIDDKLTIKQINTYITELSGTRRIRMNLHLPKDTKKLSLEKELLHLRARMLNNNQTIINR